MDDFVAFRMRDCVGVSAHAVRAYSNCVQCIRVLVEAKACTHTHTEAASERVQNRK